MDDIVPVQMNLLTENPVFKPFKYVWAYEAWLTQQRIHWLPEEVPLHEDVKNWNKDITESEKNLLTQIFRFFTQADVGVSTCYNRHYLSVFKPMEILMMLSAFSNMESVHSVAYAHLLDTVGMPETEYSAFFNYKEMKDKYDYMQGFTVENKYEIAKTLAAFGAFTEGLQLFASFAILLNFPRFNKMKGMGQIVTWSIRDECFSEDTEILTPRGWVYFKDLTDKDKVAQWKDGETNFVKPSRRVKYDRNEPLILYRRGNTISSCVTPEHDIVYIDKFYNYETKKEKAKNFIADPNKFIPVSGYKSDGNKVLTPFEKIRIAFISNGTKQFNTRSTDSSLEYLCITASPVKDKKVSKLCDLFNESYLTYRTSLDTSGNTNFYFSTFLNISMDLSSWIKLENISSEWGNQFIQELMYWNKNISYDVENDSFVFITECRENKDIIQAICAISGYTSTVIFLTDTLKYEITIRKANILSSENLTKEIVEYSGKVHCVTVPNGAVIVRHNDCVCVSGNSLHADSIIKLFRTFIQENPEIWTEQLRNELYLICATIVDHEDAFIDLAFEMGPMEGLTAEEVKQYIRYIADRRLTQLGLNVLFQIEKNPLPWLDEMLNAIEHMNFFEGRATEYSKASTTGTWEDAFAEMDLLPKPPVKT